MSNAEHRGGIPKDADWNMLPAPRHNHQPSKDTEMYEIKKGIPMPDRKESYIIYPWEDLEIGDCFDVPLDGPKVASVQHGAHQAGRR